VVVPGAVSKVVDALGWWRADHDMIICDGCYQIATEDLGWIPGETDRFFDQVRNRGGESCRHCDRPITLDGGVWVDPLATGDDVMWRESCDAHDTFTAEHEPKGGES
jgi:hypothetical protein